MCEDPEERLLRKLEQIEGDLGDLLKRADALLTYLLADSYFEATSISQIKEIVIARKTHTRLYVVSAVALQLQLGGGLIDIAIQFAIAPNQLIPIPYMKGARYTAVGQATELKVYLLHTNELITNGN